MTVLEAFLLGLVQGITEFLPVSSSGHLKLFEYLLGFEHLDRLILFDLTCHMGTLCAIFAVYRKEIKEAIRPSNPLFWQIALATLPLFPLVFIMKPIKAIYNDPALLGYFFLLTAALLFLSSWKGWSAQTEGLQKRRFRDALFIGGMQTLAILPGVSRSGSTISGGRLIGWDMGKAVTFSFLLAIPVILGATVYELADVWNSGISSPFTFPEYAIGFFTAFFFGYLALRLLIRVAVKNGFLYFAWYCMALGILSLIFIR